MKLLEVGDEHFIVMRSDKQQAMFHHEVPVAARVNGQWYRGPNENLVSIGHVNRYLSSVADRDVHWVSHEMLEQLVRSL